jgi:hypothetical protein
MEVGNYDYQVECGLKARLLLDIVVDVNYSRNINLNKEWANTTSPTFDNRQCNNYVTTLGFSQTDGLNLKVR